MSASWTTTTSCAKAGRLLRLRIDSAPLSVLASAVPPGSGRSGRDSPPSSTPSIPGGWWGSLRAARGDERPPLFAGGGAQAGVPQRRAVAGGARNVVTLTTRSFVVAALAAAAPAAVAAEAAKGDRRSGGLRLESGVHYLPHPDKKATGGEDASFVGADGLSVGVADGVGGWADQGVDAGIYARMLMGHAQTSAEVTTAAQTNADVTPAEAPEAPATPGREAKEAKPTRAEVLAPLNVLVSAHAATRVQGSSTALVLLLRKSTLHGANLGDSGFMILRAGKILFKSESQQHAFNFPFQCGSGPSDPPTAAQLYAVPVQPGDIIVCGTDGLWDNLHDTEVAALARAELAAGNGPAGAAQRIAAAAHVRGVDPRADTPFSRGAMAARVPFRGGKMDDCTVVVSIVQETAAAASA